MSAKKFFAENGSMLNPRTDQLNYNLNHGLYALAKQQEELASTLGAMRHEIQALRQEIQRLRTR